MKQESDPVPAKPGFFATLLITLIDLIVIALGAALIAYGLSGLDWAHQAQAAAITPDALQAWADQLNGSDDPIFVATLAAPIVAMVGLLWWSRPLVAQFRPPANPFLRLRLLVDVLDGWAGPWPHRLIGFGLTLLALALLAMRLARSNFRAPSASDGSLLPFETLGWLSIGSGLLVILAGAALLIAGWWTRRVVLAPD